MAKFSKRKGIIIGLGLIVVMVTFAALNHKIGYCPFLGKIIAKNKLTAYAQIQGWDRDQVQVQYDWYNGSYVGSFGDRQLSYKLQNNAIYDEEANTRENAALEELYAPIRDQFPNTVTFPEHAFLWSMVNADDYTSRAQRLYLLGVYNTAAMTADESTKMPAAIAMEFIVGMGDNFNITGIQLIYADRNGMYDIEIRGDTFQPLEYEQLLAATKKRPEERLPESYREWRQRVD
ncbi:MAG TPA: hypothetical protein VJ036_04380 [bacterium]|jgi:hypothetical protein|nr:hypothetical protein [bacterium]